MNATRLSVLGLCALVAATAVVAGPLVPGAALADSEEPTKLYTGFDTGTDGLDADRRFSSGPVSTTTERGDDSAMVVVSFSVETGDSPATLTARLGSENATDSVVVSPGETRAVELSPAVGLDGEETATLVVEATVGDEAYVLDRREVNLE